MLHFVNRPVGMENMLRDYLVCAMGLFNRVSSISSSGGCGKSRPSLPGAVGDASHVGGELGGTRRGGGVAEYSRFC